MIENSGNLQPEETLEIFGKLKNDLLNIIAEGRKIASEIPAVRDVAPPAFDMAEQAVSEKKLSIMVVGAEGVGKSTLVNSIFKQEITPEERSQPGTVAPVCIRYGNTTEYIIEFQDSRKPKKCNTEEFHKYIRQKTNQNNKEKIARGIILLDHPLLAHGLELVDMPGLEGVSDEIRKSTADSIKNTGTLAYIGLIRDRSYAPFMNIVNAQMKKDIKFLAIVINQNAEFFLKTDGSFELLANTVIADEITKARSYLIGPLTDLFKKREFKNPPAEKDLFVFNAPTLKALSNSGKMLLARIPAHIAEMEHFKDEISSYFKKNGIGAAILDASNNCISAIEKIIDSHINVRLDILKRVLGGDKTIHNEFIEARNSAIREQWNSEWTDEKLNDLAETAWSSYYEKLAKYRTMLRNNIDNTIRDIEALSEDASNVNILDKVAVVRDSVATQTDQANTSLSETLHNIVLKELINRANNVLKHIQRKFPILSDQKTIGSFKLTPEDVLHGLEIEIDQGTGRKLLKLVGIAGGAGIGAKGAILMITPDPTGLMQIAGITLVGGAAGYALINKTLSSFWGTEKQAAIKELKKIRKSLSELSTQNEDKLKKYIVESVQTLASRTDRALEARIEQIEILITQPETSQEEIKHELELVSEHKEKLQSLIDRTKLIHKTAFQYQNP